MFTAEAAEISEGLEQKSSFLVFFCALGELGDEYLAGSVSHLTFIRSIEYARLLKIASGAAL
jgi:hypothetical protein